MPCAPRVRRRHRRLADYIEAQLADVVDHVDFRPDDPAGARSELTLHNRTEAPPAVLTAIALAGLALVPDASGTQGAGQALILVCR